MKNIIMTTENLAELLLTAKKYKYWEMHGKDTNTDGEGMWHCDVEFTNDPNNRNYDTTEEVFSFDEAKPTKLDRTIEDLAWWIKENLDGTPLIFRDEQMQEKLEKTINIYRGEK